MGVKVRVAVNSGSFAHLHIRPTGRTPCGPSVRVDEPPKSRKPPTLGFEFAALSRAPVPVAVSIMNGSVLIMIDWPSRMNSMLT